MIIIKQDDKSTEELIAQKMLIKIITSIGGSSFLLLLLPLILLLAILPASLNSSIFEDKYKDESGRPIVTNTYNALRESLSIAENDSEWELFKRGISAFLQGELGAFSEAKNQADSLDSLFFVFDEDSELANEYYQGTNLIMNSLAMIFKSSYVEALKEAQLQVGEIKTVDGQKVLVPNEDIIGRNGNSYVDRRDGTERIIIDTNDYRLRTHENLPAGKRLGDVNYVFKEPVIAPTSSTAESYLMPAIYMVAYHSAYESMDSGSGDPQSYDKNNHNTYTTTRMFSKAKEITHDDSTAHKWLDGGTKYQEIFNAFIAESGYELYIQDEKYDQTNTDVYNDPWSRSMSSCPHGCRLEVDVREESVEDEYGNMLPEYVTYYRLHHEHTYYVETDVTYTVSLKLNYNVIMNPDLEKNIRESYGLTEEECDNVKANIEALSRIYKGALGWVDLGMLFQSPFYSHDMDRLACSAPYAHTDTGVHANGHDGFDVARAHANISVEGTALLAVCKAKIRVSDDGDGFGHYYVLTPLDDAGSELLYDGKKVAIYYGHCSSSNAPGITTGAIVSPGQLIGYLGNTGNSTGPHLHLEIRILNGDGSYYTVDPAANIPGFSSMPPQSF